MANLSLIRDINQARVLDLLRRRRFSSRAELAHALGLTRSTLTSLINELVERGYVVESDERVVRHSTGRPGVAVKLAQTGAYFVGADLGVGQLNVVMLDLAAEPVAQQTEDFDLNLAPEQVLDRLATLLDAMVDDVLDDASRVKGVGVTVPATHADGSIIRSPLLGWRDVVVQTPLEERLRWPVLVENDANASALAQLYDGNAHDSQNVLYLLLGAGIGAGIIVDGTIYRGAYGAAGEVGYLRLAPDGPADRKGGRGTFEAYAGAPALFQRYRELSGKEATIATLLDALAAGEPAAHEAVDAWGHWVRRGVLSLMNVLNPQRIVVGGPLSPLFPWVREMLVEAVHCEPLPGSAQVEVSLSRFCADDNAVGAAILVYHSMFSINGVTAAIH